MGQHERAATVTDRRRQSHEITACAAYSTPRCSAPSQHFLPTACGGGDVAVGTWCRPRGRHSLSAPISPESNNVTLFSCPSRHRSTWWDRLQARTEHSGSWKESNNIGRMTTAGATTPISHSDHKGVSRRHRPRSGWRRSGFTENIANKIGRLTAEQGIFRISAAPTSNAPNPNGICVGPDGALWFTESSKIGRMSTSGAITEISHQHFDRGRLFYRSGSGRAALWFTERDVGGYYRPPSHASGAYTEYPIGGGLLSTGCKPQFPHYDRRRLRWRTPYFAAGNSEVGRITTAGNVQRSPESHPNTFVQTLLLGPDGALWFS